MFKGWLWGRQRVVPPPNFARYTDYARNAVLRAAFQTRRWNHEYLGTEALLLGLLDESHGVAAQVLASLGVTADRVRAELDRVVKPGPSALPPGRLPATPYAKAVFEGAVEEARRRDHDYIGTEHLLLGLVGADCVAAQILLGLGLDADRVGRAVDAHLKTLPK